MEILGSILQLLVLHYSALQKIVSICEDVYLLMFKNIWVHVKMMLTSR